MKQPIKPFFLTLLISAMLAPIVAQAQRSVRDGNREDLNELRAIPPQLRTDTRLAVFNEYLALSDIQMDEIKKTDLELAAKAEELRGKTMRPRRKKIAAEDLKTEHQVALHNILTKDQYSIYLEHKEAIQYEIRQRLKTISEEDKQ